MKRVVFTVGSVLYGDNAAGPMLAKMMENDPIPGWEIVNGGQTPKDKLALLRTLNPEYLLLVDTADMAEHPGTIQFLSDDEVMTEYVVTSRTLPLVFLLDRLRSICPHVYYLGIQPAQTDYMSPMSRPVLAAVENIYTMLSEKGNVGIAFSDVGSWDNTHLSYTSFNEPNSAKAS